MATARKLDLYKVHAAEYHATLKPELVTIAPCQYLAISGSGQPGGENFTAALAALHNVAFTVKMESRFAGRDYGICKLEAQWWGAGNEPHAFQLQPQDTWLFQLFIRQPDYIEVKAVTKVRDMLLRRGKPKEIADVTLLDVEEGECVQLLHVGPYDQEQNSIASMLRFAQTQARHFHGRHHEIYLSDPRRVAPNRLRTILRVPVLADSKERD